MNRQELYDTMIINPGVDVHYEVERMKQNATRYAEIFPMKVPWWVVAVIHHMECSLNFDKYLGNGQPLNQVTTIVPKGRGPFATFEDGARDALQLKGANNITDWSMGNALHFLEGYNGFGYEEHHNMPSPYLWAGTNYYSHGKYTSDGKFDVKAVSNQIGVAIFLKLLL